VRTQIDYTAFAQVMNVAFGTNFPQSFDPFADDASFLIAAYVFEDTGASAYIVSISTLLTLNPFSQNLKLILLSTLSLST